MCAIFKKKFYFWLVKEETPLVLIEISLPS